MFQHLLVPLDSSELATDLVTQAVNFAKSIKARITFFTATEDYAASEEGALQRTLSPESFSEDIHGLSNAILARALVAAKSEKVNSEVVNRTGARPYELILQVAEEYGCDLIYMASHGLGGIKGLIMGSHTQKVLNHTSLPVLVVRVEKNTQSHASDTVVQIINREHREITAINDGLRSLNKLVQQSDQFLDIELLKDILLYLKFCPDNLHHKNLFERSGNKTAEDDDLIRSLEQEYRGITKAFEKIELELDNESSLDVKTLFKKINEIVKMQWSYLDQVGQSVIPLALKHLQEEDWCEIERTFRENEDIGLDGARTGECEKIFSKIINQMTLADNKMMALNWLQPLRQLWLILVEFRLS